MNNKGQSIIEVVFSLGAAALVLMGAVVLIINSLGSRSKVFDHRKASQLAESVMEDLVAMKANDPGTLFSSSWQDTQLAVQSNSDFPGYTYSIDFIPQLSSSGVCATTGNCVTAVVTVSWTNDVARTVSYDKFFSKTR